MRTLVIGAGTTGVSCARHLMARGVEFSVADSRAQPPGAAALQTLAPQVQKHFGPFSTALLDGVDQVLVSPGVSLREPLLVEARTRGIEVLGDIELFARQAQAPVAAVTGTNGKSTVTTLLAAMAQASGSSVLAGGNLGRAALDLLAEPTPDLYVLELSSFQLETTGSLNTQVAAVLNLTPDHMDRHGSVQEYAAAKARILRGSHCAVLNFDDATVRAMAPAGAQVIGFTLQENVEALYRTSQQAGDTVLMCGQEPLVALSELRISGQHNVANALAALAMADALDLDLAPCLQALRDFAGLPHRSQWVAEVAGVRYVDDSKGTNVGATLAAVNGMSGPLVMIAGGQGKGQDFAPLAQAFRGKVRHAVLIGQDARDLAVALDGATSTTFAADMDEAVQMAAQAAQPGDTVLLSPACASLDMFRDYVQRGEVFAAAVRRLGS